MNTQPMPKPGLDAPFEEKVRWLLLNYGYCAWLNKVVVLYETGDTCLRRWGAFKRAYAGWHQISQGPRGGEKITCATEVWDRSSHRLNIRDLSSRKDKPFPLFEENGELFKNTSAEVRS
jgi:hypothetical protein